MTSQDTHCPHKYQQLPSHDLHDFVFLFSSSIAVWMWLYVFSDTKGLDKWVLLPMWQRLCDWITYSTIAPPLSPMRLTRLLGCWLILNNELIYFSNFACASCKSCFRCKSCVREVVTKVLSGWWKSQANLKENFFCTGGKNVLCVQKKRRRVVLFLVRIQRLVSITLSLPHPCQVELKLHFLMWNFNFLGTFSCWLVTHIIMLLWPKKKNNQKTKSITVSLQHSQAFAETFRTSTLAHWLLIVIWLFSTKK